MPDISKSDISANLDRDMFVLAVRADLLLLRGRGHRSGGEPLLWWRGSEHLPVLQV